MRYLVGRHNKEVVERSYRAYVTNSLRLIPQMSYITKTWVDLVSGEAEDERTAEEIIDDVLGRLDEE